MSDFNQGNGWWLACDGEWYPPQSLADWRREHLADSYQPHHEGFEPRPVPSVAEPEMPASSTSWAPGWWEGSDGAWDPHESHLAQTDFVVLPVQRAG